MPPTQSAAKRRRLAQLEQAMQGGGVRGGGSGRGSGRGSASGRTLAAHLPLCPPPPSAASLPTPRRTATPTPSSSTAAAAAAALTVDDPLYDPLPPDVVAGPLAALARASGAGPPPPPTSAPHAAALPYSGGDLASILAALAATTPRGPDAAARAAALTRLAERHLLLDNPTAGLKGSGGGGGGRGAAALLTGGAAAGAAPSGPPPTRLTLSHAARRAVAAGLAGGGKTVAPAALAALSKQWRTYAAAAGLPPRPAALPPWLDLHGAPAIVTACRDGRQVRGGRGDGGAVPFPTIIAREGPGAWALADVETGRVRVVAKAGTELAVDVSGVYGGGGDGRVVVRVVGDVR